MTALKHCNIKLQKSLAAGRCYISRLPAVLAVIFKGGKPNRLAVVK